MSKIDPIITVTVDRQTDAVSQTGFGVLLILGVHRRFNELSQKYTDMDTLGAVFSSNDKEYIAANQLFAQEPKPEAVVIGRRKLNDSSLITVNSAVAGQTYTVTINGTDFSNTPSGTPTPITIAAALVASINGGAEPVNATDNLDGTFYINPTIAGTPYTLDVDGLLSISAYTTSQPAADDLDAIKEYEDNFYGVSCTERTQSVQLEVAAWVASQPKIAGFASSEDEYINQTVSTDTTSLPAKLKTLSNDRAFSAYHHDTDQYYLESGVFGDFLPRVPGSYSENYKTYKNIPISNLTPTQTDNALNKNGNVYRLVGTKNLFSNGRVSDNTPIDIIHFIDWFAARVQENVFSAIVNLPKIPYTNPGINIIATRIMEIVGEGQANGGIAFDPAPVYNIPTVNDIPTNDKANRILPDIGVDVTLQGAIEFIRIRLIVRL